MSKRKELVRRTAGREIKLSKRARHAILKEKEPANGEGSPAHRCEWGPRSLIVARTEPVSAVSHPLAQAYTCRVCNVPTFRGHRAGEPQGGVRVERGALRAGRRCTDITLIKMVAGLQGCGQNRAWNIRHIVGMAKRGKGHF